MFKSFLLLVPIVFAGLSSNAYSADTTEDVGTRSVSNTYARLIQAEHQLLKSELVVEAKKSADFEELLADGHASWLENRQQKLIVDILHTELACYERFKSQAMATLTNGPVPFESKFGSAKINSIETRLAMIQELQKQLTSLQQSKAKLAHGIMTLPANDPWLQGDRLRLAVTGHQTDVVAAKIELLERLNTLRSATDKTNKLVSATDKDTSFTAAWKRPSKDSRSIKLMITQAELQIQLSQHHLQNETRRLTDLQELSVRAMATENSVMESNKKVGAIKILLKEQQDTLYSLKKGLNVTAKTDRISSSVQARPVSGENTILNKSHALRTDLPELQSMLNDFGMGQADYLKREATLKGAMYREILSRLEQSITVQQTQANLNSTSSEYLNVLISGQQNELEHYRWEIKKTELQRDLANAEIELLKESDGTRPKNLNMLASTGASSWTLLTLPSRFLSNDPFGLQTSYSSFAFNSSGYKARRSALTTRSNLSAAFRPITNRDALSLYVGLRSAQLRNFSRFSSSNSGFQSSRNFPGSSSFRGSPFRSNFNSGSFGRSSRFSSRYGF